MSYAARHPDLFGAALAYSEAPDIAYDPDTRVAAESIIAGTEIALDHVPANSIFGNPLTDFVNWAAHDPATLPDNLRSTKLYMYFGNGVPGRYDVGHPPNAEASALEALTSRDNIDFHNRLTALGVSNVYRPYGNGTHSWPYWARDLRWSLPAIMADFAHPAPPPARFTYTSGDAADSIYGWRVALHRAIREFSTLRSAGAGGFVMRGSGTATVITPPHTGPALSTRSRSILWKRTCAGVCAPIDTVASESPCRSPDTEQEYALGPPPGHSPPATTDSTRVMVSRSDR